MTAGWIKLHRQILESPFFDNSTAVHLWLVCLLRASHEERTVLLKRERLTLNAGEFVFGYRELSRTVNCGVATAKFWMDYFESEHMIERTTTTKGTVCKLKNWEQYQNTERVPEPQRNADGTLMEPNKKDKNVKNEKKRIGDESPTPRQQAITFFNDETIREKVIRTYAERGADEAFVRAEMQKFCRHWTELTQDGKRQKWQTQNTFEVRKRLVTWLNNALQWNKPISSPK